MRAAVIASQPTDWRDVARTMLGPVPGGKAIWYQKRMTHHMPPDFGRDWIDGLSNAFLIHAPEAALASYARKRPGPIGLDEIGLPAQLALFERAADRLGRAPPVIDGRDLQADPRGALGALCAALGLVFDASMLAWPPGPRDGDGVWAPAWYAEVEKSTGFAPPAAEPGFDDLPDSLKPIAEAARPLYESLARHKLTAL
jgi:hypothetical protein